MWIKKGMSKYQIINTHVQASMLDFVNTNIHIFTSRSSEHIV